MLLTKTVFAEAVANGPDDLNLHLMIYRAKCSKACKAGNRLAEASKCS